ncbi:unnamed protein product [Blepharisma stoltei]|uniref:Uncharacterized protein n=1 Tax=Blepharisma stoltei TaxID=1481888 RepID=A0AAU9IW42_9CILI|nr:unnamed protein product [Blepharisma stoltei]
MNKVRVTWDEIKFCSKQNFLKEKKQLKEKIDKRQLKLIVLFKYIFKKFFLNIEDQKEFLENSKHLRNPINDMIYTSLICSTLSTKEKINFLL